MTTTIDGIVSGLDTTSLIKAILTSYTVGITTLKAQSAETEARQQAVAGVKNLMVTLSSSIKDMDTPAEFRSLTATSSSSQFKLTADSLAVAGNYAIRTVNLASSQQTVSDGVDDKAAAAFGTGTMAITVGGTTTNLTVDSTNNSLVGMAAALSKVTGLSAYVVDTGNVTGRYQLVVQGNDTGAANAFTLDTSGLTGTPPGFTDTDTAVDATAIVSGVTIHSASNHLDGVIPGLDIELLQPGAVADTAVVASDRGGMKDKLQKVVDAYNAVLDYYGAQTVYNPAEDLRGHLVGEGSTRRALGDLAGTITNRFTVSGSTLSSLAELGVKTAQDGHLSLDATVFDDKLAADPNGVTTFLTDATGPLASVRDKIDDLYVDEDNGGLTSTVDGLGETVKQLEDQITKTTDRMNAQSEMLRAKFSAMEVVLGQLKNTGSYLTSIFGSNSSSSNK